MPRTVARRHANTTALPRWILPQLTQLVDAAPNGDQWLHEIKYDGYRMHARLDHGAVKLLTRTGLDWTRKYPAIAKAVAALDAREAYLDGELCGVGPDGVTTFSRIQTASDAGNAAGLVFFVFDLLHLDGEDLAARPLILRKQRLAALLPADGSPLHYSDHVIGEGPSFYDKACAMHVEGIVRNASMRPTRLATAACGARPNASTAPNLSLSAGPILKAAGHGSAPCCSATTIRTEG
jgi:ATP-dependent DNA ligase